MEKMEKLTYDELHKQTNRLTDNVSSTESQMLVGEQLYQTRDGNKRKISNKYENVDARDLKCFSYQVVKNMILHASRRLKVHKKS